MIRRLVTVLFSAFGLVVLLGSSAFACGGLIAPGHAEVLRRATTLSAWHAGFEHYVTGFTFAGNAEHFGYIVPLPGNPTRIEKGGDWTLERLEREINPPVFLSGFAAGKFAAAESVRVIQEVKVDALDIKIVQGGGRDVAAWARHNGFDLTPDTDTVLGTYSAQNAIFAVAKFDGLLARDKGLAEGQGTTIHFTIPTSGAWIPLRILALGKAPAEEVDADLFVLTDTKPVLAPSPSSLAGMTIVRSAPASGSLLNDLRSDKGMAWVPPSMWFTALKLSALAPTVHYDLSIDGARPVAAPRSAPVGGTWLFWMSLTAAMAGLIGILRRSLREQPAA